MEDLVLYFIYAVAFLYGIVIGSFLNVCIYRIPAKESIASERSHCMSCGYQLKWYDLFPLFSWLFLGGKCRKCKAPISKQYPIIEATNALLYVVIFVFNGFNVESVLYCFMASALLALSIIDWRTFEIPVGFNVFIFLLGVVRVILAVATGGDWLKYIIGCIAVSAVLWIIFQVSKGAAIGGGDVKLMGAAGLLIGWKMIILSFFLACIIGSVIHITRMKISNEGRQLAMGPYLSIGIFIASLWGEQLIGIYLRFLGI